VCGPGLSAYSGAFRQDARVWDREKVVIIPDHYIFTKTKMANRNVASCASSPRAESSNTSTMSHPQIQGGLPNRLAQRGHTRPGEALFGNHSPPARRGVREFATGIGNTDAASSWGPASLGQSPPTIGSIFHGQLPPYLMAQDSSCGDWVTSAATGPPYKAMEFDGDGVYASTSRNA